MSEKKNALEVKKVIDLEIIEKSYLINKELFHDGDELESGMGKENDIETKMTLSNYSNYYFYEIEEISYEEKFPHKEAFENVISSINDSGFNFIYLLSGNQFGVKIYVGIADNLKIANDEKEMNSFDVSEAMVNSLLGNFLGTSVRKLSKDDVNSRIINEVKNLKRKSFIYGIPSENEKKQSEETIFQGIDRLINSMRGESFQFMIVGEPVTNDSLNQYLQEVFSFYNEIARLSECDYSENQSSGSSFSLNEGISDSRGENKSISTTKSSSRGSESSSSSEGKSVSDGTNTSRTTSKNETKGTSDSKGKTIGVKVVEKRFKSIIEYLDEEMIPRLKLGLAKGMFKTAVYAMAKDSATLNKLEGNIRSIFQGEKSTYSPLRAIKLSPDLKKTENIDRLNRLLSCFQIYYSKRNNDSHDYLLNSIPVYENHAEFGTLLTVREVSLIAGLPIREVPGIKLIESVDFGLTVDAVDNGIELGNILQHGNNVLKNKVCLKKDILKKHIFVSGVTGSGKTTTCKKILISSGLPFMVIEPAKTEYRTLFAKDKTIKYYTVGRNDLLPFRFNPLEIIKGENLSGHIDMLMATFCAVYPMEASIPYLLKEAIINCYEKLGWDLDGNCNKYSDDPFNDNGLYFPTFSNLVSELKKVVETKKFASELKANYIATLVSRFQDLILGTRGSIFNVVKSIDFEKIIDEKVVIELDELKNQEDKSLLMGFILSRLTETIKLRYKKDNSFQHITLIEEAHRLLAKPEITESAKKQAVNTFTDMLAEVRKYGESLIIVDQIPSILTPEILKNTNTKIIHKIFAEDDKKAIGACIGLDDKQTGYLSKLNAGVAVVFTEGWHKPVLVKVKADIDTEEVTEEEIAAMGKGNILSSLSTFFPNFAEYQLNESQINFLLSKKNGIVKKLIKEIDLKDTYGPTTLKKLLREFQTVFDLDEKLFGAIADDIWTNIKIFYYDEDIREFYPKAKKWIIDYLKTIETEGKLPELVSVEGKFLSKIKEKIKTI